MHALAVLYLFYMIGLQQGDTLCESVNISGSFINNNMTNTGIVTIVQQRHLFPFLNIHALTI